MAEPDFRALCAELIGWGERTADHYYTLPEVLIRARTALEQTEPKPQDDPTSNRPLWEVMSNVYPGTTSTNVSKLYAAELRAIADWLVPEEDRIDLMQATSKLAWGRAMMRDERQRLRLELLAEAERAEAEE